MTTHPREPRRVPCTCGDDAVRVKRDGTYYTHTKPAYRGPLCRMSGQPVPAEMFAKADARDDERAARDRRRQVEHDVHAAEDEVRRARRDVSVNTDLLAAARGRLARALEAETAARSRLAEDDARVARAAALRAWVTWQPEDTRPLTCDYGCPASRDGAHTFGCMRSRSTVTLPLVRLEGGTFAVTSTATDSVAPARRGEETRR